MQKISKPLFVLSVILFVSLPSCVLLASSAAVKKASMSSTKIKPMKEFVDDLMAKMTLQEKIGQLNLLAAGDIMTGGVVETKVGNDIVGGNVGGVFNVKGVEKIRTLQDLAVKKSRLGIPLLVGMDVIHGYETIFPIPLALSCSWDMDALEQSASVAAREATADGINWTFSPMVDVALDARWGRIAEGNGEDPYLGSVMAPAMVRGYQGRASRKETILPRDKMLACLKHFALYGAVEGGLEYNTSDMSRLRMFNQYLPPYEAAVKAGVATVMSSFNLIDYVPATANRWMMTDVLRGRWGFDGMLVTDYESIVEMLKHGTAKDLKDASRQALLAGTDMDMCSKGYVKTLAESVRDGSVSEKAVDMACRRVLEAKYRLGLFADPYRYCDAKRAKKELYTEESRRTARDIAAETFVLLKNDNRLLPLKKEGTIALIGPLANTRNNMVGTWCVAYTPEKYSTLKEAMERALAGKARLLYAQGSNIWRDAQLQKYGEFGKTIERGDDARMKEEALATARQADVIVCAMGETSDMTGECATRTNLEMPDVQHELLDELVKLGKPVVLLNFSGRPTVLSWEKRHLPAIMNVWFGGSEAGDAICDVLFGDKVPSGKLTTSLPKVSAQEPLYYNHLNTGRPVPDDARKFAKYASNYLDIRNGALYPFGYGLSYTTFEYGDIHLSTHQVPMDSQKASEWKNGEHVTASITVRNTGNRDADEIVQLYIRDMVCSIARPVIELRGFRRIHLSAGESREVSFEVTPEMLKFYNAELEHVIEPGEFQIMIGADCKKVKKETLKVVL